MRFGIRPQAVLLAAVPLASLLLLLTLGSLLVEQTRQGAITSSRADADLTRAEQMIETISSTNRSVQQYARTKSPADLAAVEAAQSALAAQARAFERALRNDPALASRGEAYARFAVRGMDVMTSYAHALRDGKTALAARIAGGPATRQLSADLEHSKVVFDEAVQAQNAELLSVRRDAARKVEGALMLVALSGIVLTMLVALLFGIRIVNRLQLLGDNARRLSDGEPTLPDTGNDEITELDRIYRAMAERIKTSSQAQSDLAAELRRERDVAAVLQEALLPEIPQIAGLRLDSAYVTPAEGAQIGGDWFDVFEIAEGVLGLSVGDVTGHGLRAAATMSFVRQAIRIVARLEGDVGVVMERVNRLVCEDGGTVVTAFFGVFDRERGTLAYVIAGHAPPLVALSGGTIEHLPGEGMLLGVDRDTRFTPYERQLIPGDALVLYTDGIVEAERDYFKGMTDLEAAVRVELAAPSENIAEGIQGRIFNASAPRDDSAVLVLKVLELAPAAPAHQIRSWHFDARDQRTAWRVKREVLGALEALGSPVPDLHVAELAFGELLSNVIRHTPGSTRVSFEVEDGQVVLKVADRGGPIDELPRVAERIGEPDADAECGRGLFLIGALGGTITIQPSEDGKCVSVALPPAAGEAYPESRNLAESL
jgi:serine phosphatase RsbU (regulator of sigma subunit)/anti-sigma regulatory factor (Ser/Thr protein kinase)